MGLRGWKCMILQIWYIYIYIHTYLYIYIYIKIIVIIIIIIYIYVYCDMIQYLNISPDFCRLSINPWRHITLTRIDLLSGQTATRALPGPHNEWCADARKGMVTCWVVWHRVHRDAGCIGCRTVKYFPMWLCPGLIWCLPQRQADATQVGKGVNSGQEVILCWHDHDMLLTGCQSS